MEDRIGLFRAASVTAQSELAINGVTYLPRKSVWITIFFTFFLLALSILALVLLGYSKTIELQGILLSESHSKKVVAPLSGIVTKTFTDSGAIVSRDTPILEITPVITDIDKAQIKRRIKEIESITQAKKREVKLLESESLAIGMKIKIEEEILKLANSENLRLTSNAREDRSSLQNEFTKIKSIVEKNLVQGSELDSIQKSINDLNREEKRLEYEVKRSRLNHSDKVLEWNRLIETSKHQIANRKDEIMLLNSEALELQDTSSSIAYSSIPGKIGNLHIQGGSYVSTGDTIFEVLPQGTGKNIMLFASTTEVGFIKIGQNVRLKIPHVDLERNFELLGIIESIEFAPIVESRLLSFIPVPNSDSVYIVNIKLSSDDIGMRNEFNLFPEGTLINGSIGIKKERFVDIIRK